MTDTAFTPDVESTLGLADEPNVELRARIIRAQAFTVSWLKAIGANANPLGFVLGDVRAPQLVSFYGRIIDMRTALKTLLELIPADGFFAGNDAAKAYERASAGFAQLYRDLALSVETLPHPDMLDRAADLVESVFIAPTSAITAVAEMAANAIGRALGGTAAAIWLALWPWLIVAGGVGVVYVFRAPIGRAVGKVSQ